MDKLGSIRISAELHQWLNKTQLEERVSTGREPSYRELLDRMFVVVMEGQNESAIGPPASAETSYPYREENRELHEKLEDILVSSDEATIDAVVPNIKVFHERLRPKPKRSSRQPRAVGD